MFKNLKRYGLLKQIPLNFLKLVFHEIYSVHSWIFCLIYPITDKVIKINVGVISDV